MNPPKHLAVCTLLASVALAACTSPPLVPRVEYTATSPRSTTVDWRFVQPVADVSVHPMSAAERDRFRARTTSADAQDRFRDLDGIFVVEGRIVDLKSGTALAKPWLIVRRGSEATIEIGVAEQVSMKMTILIDKHSDNVDTATEVRDGGKLVKTSTTRFAIAPT